MAIVKVPEKGQVTLPIELRRQLRIGKDDDLMVEAQGDALKIRKVRERKLLGSSDPTWGSDPARQRKAVIAAKAAQLKKLSLDQRQEDLLQKIAHGIWRSFNTMERKSLSDRVIDKIRILPNERISGSFIAANAAGQERLFFLGHEP